MGGGGGGSKKQTVGYKYYLGMHIGICHGPVNYLRAIYVGERVLFDNLTAYNPNSSTRISVSKLDLFGGERKEGGVEGFVDILWGSSNQAVNAYLSEQLESTWMSAFRGIFSLVLNQCYVCAGAPYPKPWWVVATRLPGSSAIGVPWNSVYAQPTLGSANGAHIIREAFIDTDWGLGYPSSQLDDASFTAAAIKLNAEAFGLSYLLSDQGPIEELIQEVLKTINGVVYTNRETGKFVLKLIRDDYIVDDLPVFDENNILEYTSFQRPQPAEMVNEVTIVYRKKLEPNDSSLTFQNLAAIISQGAIISQKLEYPGIDDTNIASLVGMRELRQYSTPLAQVVFTANRQAWNLNPGDPFVFTWIERGISQLVMRATKINYGELKDGKIEVTAIEDIFGLPTASYIEPQDPFWQDPQQDPTPIALVNRYQFEVPYFTIATNFETPNIEVLTESSSYIISVSSFPAYASASFEMWSAVAPSTNYTLKVTGTYCHRLYINEDITETPLDNEVDIIVTNIPSDFITDTPIGSLCLIGIGVNDEFAILSGYNALANTITLKRGALDTLPKAHAIGTPIWFFDDNWAFDGTEYVDGSQVNIKLLPRTGLGLLDIDEAEISSLVMTGRQYKPSPPSYIRIFDFGIASYRFFPTSIRGNFLIGWRKTNRITQTVEGSAPYFYGSEDVLAEDGVVWNIIIYKEDLVTIALDYDASALSVSYGWVTEEADSGLSGRLNNVLRVIFKAVRIEDGIRIDSHEEFDLTIERRGFTYQFDKYFDGGE